MEETIGLPRVVLADTGLPAGRRWQTCRPAASSRWSRSGEHSRTGPTTSVRRRSPLKTDDAKALYKRRKQTVEPVFGIKTALGFVHFRLRGLQQIATEWTLIALAYNCRRITRLQAA